MDDMTDNEKSVGPPAVEAVDLRDLVHQPEWSRLIRFIEQRKALAVSDLLRVSAGDPDVSKEGARDLVLKGRLLELSWMIQLKAVVETLEPTEEKKDG